jgi:quercetin dioxygenase-like cupin family protein
MHTCKLVSFAVATVAVVCLAAVQDPKPAPQAPVPIMLAPADLKWVDGPPGLPAGGQIAMLAGDPSKAEVFTMRGKLPANYKIPPHWHPGTENITVLSGTMYFAMGDTFDAAAGKGMPAGSFCSLPGKQHHYAWTKEETIIQITAMGPFEITYVNPADDPRGAAKKGAPK